MHRASCTWGRAQQSVRSGYGAAPQSTGVAAAVAQVAVPLMPAAGPRTASASASVYACPWARF